MLLLVTKTRVEHPKTNESQRQSEIILNHYKNQWELVRSLGQTQTWNFGGGGSHEAGHWGGLHTLISPPPGWCFTLSLELTFDLALLLKSIFRVSIFLSPPPGLWAAFSNEPIFDLAFHCNFVVTIYGFAVFFFCGGFEVRVGADSMVVGCK